MIPSSMYIARPSNYNRTVILLESASMGDGHNSHLSAKVFIRAVFTWLSKVIGFGFGFTTPFGWLVYLLSFWFYDSQVKTALTVNWTSQKSILGILLVSFGHKQGTN